MAIKWENTLDILSLRQRVFKPQVILRLLWFFFFLSKSVCKVAFYDLINYTFIPVKLCTWRLSYIKIIPISEVNLLAHLNWFSFFFPFISFLGLYLFIFYLYIFHQNWGGENPTKLWWGTVRLVFLLSCWNWVYKECENSLWEAALCDCLQSGQCLIWDFLTVLENMLQAHNLIHFARPGFANVPAEVELFLLRELMFNSENCLFFSSFFLKFSSPEVVHVQTRIWFDGSCRWRSLLVHFSSRNSVM